MSKQNDMYTRDGDDDSQVRNIIRRLNEEKPATEKSREVVVRADGTKAVRVTKKRKIMMTNEERNRRSRRSFVVLLLAGMLLCAAFVAFFMFRMTTMTGESYLREQENRLKETWGAAQVKCSGASIDGMSLSIAGIVVDFPESSLIQHMELSSVSASLSASTFLFGKIKADELSIGRATLQLNPKARTLQMPKQIGEPLWKIKRVICADLNLYMGNSEAESPVVLRQAPAYMYGPVSSRVVMLNGGLLMLNGWKPISLTEGKMRFTPHSIEDINLRGTIDPSRRKADGRPESFIALSGTIAGDAPLAGPLMVDSDNMNFTDFTDGAFTHFFSAFTDSASMSKQKPTAHVELPLDTLKPRFYGQFRVRDIRITAFPAMMIYTEHIDPKYRKRYMPPYITSGLVSVAADDNGKTLEIVENDMVERDLLSLRAKVTVDSANQLSGTVDYGLPAILTRVEYPDGLSDPMFKEDGRNAWFCTQVSGSANQPTDNAAQLDVDAEAQRKFRPARTPFDRIDVERLSERIKASAPAPEPAPQQPSAQPMPSSDFQLQPQSQPSAFPATQEPSAPTSLPTEGRLTLPLDNSIFGGGF